MSEKKALVFDTNFILENTDLVCVVDTLKDDYNVYITQVSIEERLSQRQFELGDIFRDLEKVRRRLKGISKISLSKSLEECIKKDKEIACEAYMELFGERIIPFKQSNDIFVTVFKRALIKQPPFISEKGASDKGFKDCLIWLSLLEYFQDREEEEVLFLTNDNGFRKYADSLGEEFLKATGKKITIKENSYYKSYKDTEKPENETPETSPPLPDVKLIREEISQTVNSLCGDEIEDDFGRPEWVVTFTLKQKVDAPYMEAIFDHFEEFIKAHLFDPTIKADEVFELDDRVTNGIPVSITALENALTLQKSIKQKLPEYLPQFYSAAATIFNKNYRAFADIDDDLPF